jgi:thiosulfate reductase cytochrome b subunit
MSTLDGEAPAARRIVVRKHHWLVRLSHWMNVVVLTGLVMSGLSIYWASPVFQHAPNRRTGVRDWLADAGLALGHSKSWIYDTFGLGTFALADALQLHWLFAYLLMLTAVLYAIGLLAGGGWRGLVPRRGQLSEALRMQWYYVGALPMKLLRRPWNHPPITTKYNGLQRTAYASMPVAGLLIIASGWAMHKPAQLFWLERLFGSYDGARIVHFLMMCVFLLFVIPHVVLAAADGWDTMRSMVVGWSDRVPPQLASVAAPPAPALAIALARREMATVADAAPPTIDELQAAAPAPATPAAAAQSIGAIRDAEPPVAEIVARDETAGDEKAIRETPDDQKALGGETDKEEER